MPMKQTHELPVEVHVPAGFPITWSNWALVQASGPDIVLSFFQAIAPFAKTQEEFDAMPHIPAECVARIAMNPLAALRFLAGLQDVMSAFQQAMSGQAPKGGDGGQTDG